MNKTYKINPGDEIIITVPRKKAEAKSLPSAAPPKAMIRPRKSDDFLPRRLKKSGFINFYDLGQSRDGDGWRTNEFGYVPTLAYDENQTSDPLIVERLPLLQLRNFETQILSVPAADFKNEFRRVTKADAPFFPIIVTAAGTVHDNRSENDGAWTSVGLKLTAAELSEIEGISPSPLRGCNFFNSILFSFSPLGYPKFTTAPRFDSPEAVFTPQKTADWFLMPQITRREGYSNNDSASYLNFDYKLRERYFGQTGIVTDTVTGEVEALNRMSSIPPTRSFRVDTSASPRVLVPGSFVLGAASAIVYNNRLVGYEFGVLLAVIHQNGEQFYCWQRALG